MQIHEEQCSKRELQEWDVLALPEEAWVPLTWMDDKTDYMGKDASRWVQVRIWKLSSD